MNDSLNQQPNVPFPPPAPASNNNDRIMAIASLVLGVLNLCAWFLPICGVPIGIAGLVLGYFGQRAVAQKTLAIIGMVLSGVGLLLACGNGAWGAWNYINNSGNFNF